MKQFTAVALQEFPLVNPGDDIAQLIIKTMIKNEIRMEDDDVVVIAQKIFSKAEDRVIDLRGISPSPRARSTARKTRKDPRLIELVLREAKRLVKAARDVVIVEDKRGLVCINAGLDKSNVEGRYNYALLPAEPDESARQCRARIRELTGKRVAVIITDTYSRPFRRGQVNFAIGIAGIDPFRDYRGKKDLFGLILKVKNVSVVDEIAAAGELLMGQGREKTPVVILKGLTGIVFTEQSSLSQELISISDDLFKGTL